MCCVAEDTGVIRSGPSTAISCSTKTSALSSSWTAGRWHQQALRCQGGTNARTAIHRRPDHLCRVRSARATLRDLLWPNLGSAWLRRDSGHVLVLENAQAQPHRGSNDGPLRVPVQPHPLRREFFRRPGGQEQADWRQAQDCLPIDEPSMPRKRWWKAEAQEEGIRACHANNHEGHASCQQHGSQVLRTSRRARGNSAGYVGQLDPRRLRLAQLRQVQHAGNVAERAACMLAAMSISKTIKRLPLQLMSMPMFVNEMLNSLRRLPYLVDKGAPVCTKGVQVRTVRPSCRQRQADQTRRWSMS